MSRDEYCSCGNEKYPDALMCDVCFNKQVGYDSPNDDSHCACGRPKYVDAICCDMCYRKQQGYN